MILVVMAAGVPANRVTDTEWLTATHLTIIAVLAVLTLLGILWGSRLKRRRVNTETEARDRTDALSAHPPTAAAPPPPPLDDALAQSQPAEAPRASQVQTQTTAPEPAPAPTESETSPPAAASASPAGYQLLAIKGLGPKAVPLLAALGIDDLATLAALDDARAAEVNGQLGPLSGRMARDRWVEQARLLQAGDVAAFEATFGKL